MKNKVRIKKSVKPVKNYFKIFILPVIFILLVLGFLFYFHNLRLTGNVVSTNSNGDCVNIPYNNELWSGVNNSLGVVRSTSPTAVSYQSSFLCSDGVFYACNPFSNSIACFHLSGFF